MHATEFLADAQPTLLPVIICVGTQWKLRQNVLARLVDLALGGDDASLTRLTGKTAEWPNVKDELSMVSMWGGPPPDCHRRGRRFRLEISWLHREVFRAARQKNRYSCWK